LALELLKYVAIQGQPCRFLLCFQCYIRKYIFGISDPALKNSLLSGVGYVYDSQPKIEKEIVETLFKKKAIQILISTPEISWSRIDPTVSILLGTEYNDGSEYSLTYLLQMIGIAKKLCILLCREHRKYYYLQCLLEPISLESQLRINLHDHLNTEIVTGVIDTKQEAVDYLTWTFFYRRLHLNPNYYGLSGNSNRHISSYLSELVETILEDLSHSGCIIIQTNNWNIVSSNFGRISSHYCIKYTTIEMFKASLHAESRQRGIIEILCASTEFEHITIRKGEKMIIDKIISTVPFLSQSLRISESQRKTLSLLVAQFSRLEIQGDLKTDLKDVLLVARKLISALVDVVASLGLVKPLLSAMELSQMLTQGQWSSDSPLIQLPHMNRDFINRCDHIEKLDTIYGLIDTNKNKRRKLVDHLPVSKRADLTKACNKYPDIHIDANVLKSSDPETETKISIILQNKTITRYCSKHKTEQNYKSLSKFDHDLKMSLIQSSFVFVNAPRYPACVLDEWWIMGVNGTHSMLFIKKICLKMSLINKCDVELPSSVGRGVHNFTLHLISDSYCGCDQEHNIECVAATTL
jgi:pre-mRNA-splicing helicase BRR2